MLAAASLPAPACACGRLRRASRALTQLYDDLMAPSGLRVTQFSLLRTLATRGTARMSDLARALLLDRTALSRTLDPLVERGLVEIAPGRDARTREVSLTRAGAKAIRSAAPHWQRAQSQVVARIGPAKLDALIATLAEVEQLHPDPGGSEH
jgi:DNA-binding MarR family transcriptional regulator